MAFPIFETERLNLVHITQRYKDEFFDIMSRDEVTKYYGSESLTDPEEAARLIDAFQFGYESGRGMRWGIIWKESGQFLGTVGLNNLNVRAKKAEVGYELHPDFWGKGITKEAVSEILRYCFEERELYRIGAVTFPENEPSSGLLKKLGFSEEGRLRGYLYQKGESYDALIFSLLKPEWEERT